MEEIKNEKMETEEVKGFDIDEFEEDFDFEDEPEKKGILGTVKSVAGTVVSKVKDGATWVINHPEEAGAGALAILGGLAVAKTVSDVSKLERTVYDEHTGESILLKKKLSNKDKIELDERMSEGETKIKALDRMNKIR